MQWLQRRNRQLVQHHRLLLVLHRVQDHHHQEPRQALRYKDLLLPKEGHLLDIMDHRHQDIMDPQDILVGLMVVLLVGLQ